MKTRFLFVSSLAASLFLLGCYTFPSKSGQWTGVTRATRLYTWEGEEQECVILVFQTSPVLKDFKPKEAVLVKTDGYCFMPHDLLVKSVRVNGVLTTGFPLSQKTGKPLIRHSKEEPNKTFEDQWIVIVKKLEVLP